MSEQSSDLSNPYIQAQIVARQRSAVIKTRYMIYRSRYPNGLIFAVEGDDDKIVYSYWISRVTPQLSYEFFVCGGKRSVRQLRNALHSDLSGSDIDVLFLVDRDFDDLLGFDTHESVFMLDCYSIENYLVDSRVLSNCIRAAYPGGSVPDIRERICSLFNADYQIFLDISREINKRIFIARRLVYHIDEYMPISLATICQVDLGAVKTSGVRPSQTIPFPAEPDADTVRDLSSEFDSFIPAQRYRGKFAIKFFRAWLDALAQEYRKPRIGLFALASIESGKIKHDDMSLGSLASRASLPQGFASFVLAYVSV